MKLHTLTEPLITLHDARGRIVFAAPLYHHSEAEVIYTQPWDWVESAVEKEKLRQAYQTVLFDRKKVVVRFELSVTGDKKITYECRATPVDTNEVTMMVSSVAIEENRSGNITGREAECLRHLIGGLHTKGIAKAMNVKATTVNTYKQRLKEKLGVDSLAGLIAWGCRHLA
ncbi:MAG: helix-turn-helix transcriptional regulator [Pirellulaceae bacterium]